LANSKIHGLLRSAPGAQGLKFFINLNRWPGQI